MDVRPAKVKGLAHVWDGPQHIPGEESSITVADKNFVWSGEGREGGKGRVGIEGDGDAGIE